MEKKKLSVKALMSLILSAILFCMPMGAFFANRANTVEVHAGIPQNGRQRVQKIQEIQKVRAI